VEANLLLVYDLTASLAADLSWAHGGTKAAKSHILPPRKKLITQELLKASLGHWMLSPALFCNGAMGFSGNHHHLLLVSSLFPSY